MKNVKSRSLVFIEWEPGTDFHWYLIENKKTKIVFYIYTSISEHIPVRFSVLKEQKCLQPSRRQDWLWLTRDKVTYKLDHILLQDLSWYEDRQSAQIYCHQQAGRLSPLIADGKYRNTSSGRKTWRTLINSAASLQRHCNTEGFNAMFKNWASKASMIYLASRYYSFYLPHLTRLRERSFEWDSSRFPRKNFPKLDWTFILFVPFQLPVTGKKKIKGPILQKKKICNKWRNCLCKPYFPSLKWLEDFTLPNWRKFKSEPNYRQWAPSFVAY